MPLHVQSMLRAREEITEAAGMTQDVDSRGVTIKLAQEIAGWPAKLVPKMTVWFLGKKYTPNSTSTPTEVGP